MTIPYISAEEEIRQRMLKSINRYGEDYYDWDTILSRDAMLEALEHYGGRWAVCQELKLSIRQLEGILRIHGIRSTRKQRDYMDGPPLPECGPEEVKAVLASVGETYTAKERVAMIASLHQDTCSSLCVLAIECWGVPIPTGQRRHKKPECRLREHLELVGLGGTHGR